MTLNTLAGSAARRSTDLPHRRSLIAVEMPRSTIEGFLERMPLAEQLQRATVSWERPCEGSRLLAFGAAARLQSPRNSALRDARAQIRSLTAAVSAETSFAARPRFFGGMRFIPGGRHCHGGWDAFGGWQFVLPRVLLTISGERVAGSVVVPAGDSARATEFAERALGEVTTAAPVTAESGADPIPPRGVAEWMVSVEAALGQIEEGRYEKVVLALRSHLETPRPVHQGKLLECLGQRYPNCYTFRFVAGEGAWLGASPELLVALQGGVVRAASLAGSRPRGATEAADKAIAGELLASAKEQSEHRLVVQALMDSLRPLCSDVAAPDEPEIMRLANIQHLYTPVTAIPKAGTRILDLVEAVHPTPAVAGAPRGAAVEAIEALEGMDRGWYAAPIGWFDLDGEGEFAVGLRSGLIRGRQVDLFSGAGIVHASEPAAELDEVEQKLRALRETIEAVQE